MDCSFKTPVGWFTYKVGAIIIRNGKVLMVRNQRDPYYYAVGGRVKMNETMEEAIIREVLEETGVLFEIDRLGYIHENLFIMKPTGERFHELCIFYFMKPNDRCDVICKSYNEDGISETLEWLPIDDLENCDIYPKFFITKLAHPQSCVEHIITRE